MSGYPFCGVRSDTVSLVILIDQISNMSFGNYSLFIYQWNTTKRNISLLPIHWYILSKKGSLMLPIFKELEFPRFCVTDFSFNFIRVKYISYDFNSLTFIPFYKNTDYDLSQ